MKEEMFIGASQQPEARWRLPGWLPVEQRTIAGCTVLFHPARSELCGHTFMCHALYTDSRVCVPLSPPGIQYGVKFVWVWRF